MIGRQVCVASAAYRVRLGVSARVDGRSAARDTADGLEPAHRDPFVLADEPKTVGIGVPSRDDRHVADHCGSAVVIAGDDLVVAIG